MGVKKNTHLAMFALSLILAGYFFAQTSNLIGAIFLVAAFLLIIFRNQFYDLLS